MYRLLQCHNGVALAAIAFEQPSNVIFISDSHRLLSPEGCLGDLRGKFLADVRWPGIVLQGRIGRITSGVESFDAKAVAAAQDCPRIVGAANIVSNNDAVHSTRLSS